MQKLTQIQTRLTPDQIDWLDERAAKASTPAIRLDRAKLIREAVETYRYVVGVRSDAAGNEGKRP